jgi:hypothetical protein
VEGDREVFILKELDSLVDAGNRDRGPDGFDQQYFTRTLAIAEDPRMGLPSGELLNPCLIRIDENIVGQRFDFAIASKLHAAIPIIG